MQDYVTEEQEISLRDIFEALKRQRRIIFIVTGVTVMIGLLYAIFTTPLYTASVTVQPVSEDKPGGLGGLASQFGGLASMAGISIGGAGSDTVEYIAILKSREFGQRFIEQQNLKPHLFPDRWDESAEKWKGGSVAGDSGGFLSGIKRGISRTLAKISGDEGWGKKPSGPEPSMWEAYKQLNNEIRFVSEDKETGLVILSFEFRDPELAAEWAKAYVAMANSEIRAQAIEEASRALEYLNREVEKTTVSGLRDTVYKLVESQLERIMLANARDEYAFKVIDAAVVPEDRSHPKRALIVVLALVFGGILGVFGGIVREVAVGGFVREVNSSPNELVSVPSASDQ